MLDAGCWVLDAAAAAAAANAGCCCQGKDEPTAQQTPSQAQAQPGQAEHSAEICMGEAWPLVTERCRNTQIVGHDTVQYSALFQSIKVPLPGSVALVGGKLYHIGEFMV
jgi:hypothetical protein